jgi:hypothetical protein
VTIVSGIALVEVPVVEGSLIEGSVVEDSPCEGSPVSRWTTSLATNVTTLATTNSNSKIVDPLLSPANVPPPL